MGRPLTSLEDQVTRVLIKLDDRQMARFNEIMEQMEPVPHLDELGDDGEEWLNTLPPSRFSFSLDEAEVGHDIDTGFSPPPPDATLIHNVSALQADLSVSDSSDISDHTFQRSSEWLPLEPAPEAPLELSSDPSSPRQGVIGLAVPPLTPNIDPLSSGPVIHVDEPREQRDVILFPSSHGEEEIEVPDVLDDFIDDDQRNVRDEGSSGSSKDLSPQGEDESSGSLSPLRNDSCAGNLENSCNHDPHNDEDDSTLSVGQLEGSEKQLSLPPGRFSGADSSQVVIQNEFELEDAIEASDWSESTQGNASDQYVGSRGETEVSDSDTSITNEYTDDTNKESAQGDSSLHGSLGTDPDDDA